MPRRKVALSGLLAFGAGVAVGANWPRAGNIVGYLLQRLGFELTDLTLWMWDPEKSVIQETQSKRISVRKRAQTPPSRVDHALHARSRGKAKTRTRSSRISPGKSLRKVTAKTRADALEPWILNSTAPQSARNGSRGLRLKSSAESISGAETAHRGARRGRKKTNGATVKGGSVGRIQSAGNVRKAKAFSETVSPASAALN
jgi:hypothetical protein